MRQLRWQSQRFLLMSFLASLRLLRTRSEICCGFISRFISRGYIKVHSGVQSRFPVFFRVIPGNVFQEVLGHFFSCLRVCVFAFLRVCVYACLRVGRVCNIVLRWCLECCL